MRDTIKSVEAFQVEWIPGNSRFTNSGWIRITTEAGLVGYGEVSPMMGGDHSIDIINRYVAPIVIGADPLDHAVLYDRALHKLVKLGPEGAVTGALAGVDIALWDLKGKLLDQPIYKLLGGAWRTELPFYSSVGGNQDTTVEETVARVERRWRKEQPSAIKFRLDGDRTRQDSDISGDIAKIRAVRALVGDDMPLAFDANNQYSISGAMQVGRVLEDLGYAWFEEPVQHYHVHAMGEVAQRLSITVSAGEQSYTTQALVDLIRSGVRMVQPDIIKMGGITGLMQCAAICFAHGVEFVPHQTQPGIGHMANLHVLSTVMHMTKPAEYADASGRTDIAFTHPIGPENGRFKLGERPGLGLDVNDEEIARRRV
jgi:L-alanine-DL-glutamate epimerase-like enolase superfamily enzyme